MRRRVAFGLAFGRVLRGGLSPLSLALMLPLVATGASLAAATERVPIPLVALASLAFVLAWIGLYGPVHRAIVMPRWRRRAKRLGDVRAFALAAPGHAVLLLVAVDGAWGAIAGWRHGQPVLAILGLLFAVGALAALLLLSPWSPWTRGPSLIALPHSVQILGYRVPWTGIESVGLSSTGMPGAWIRTRATLSAYSRHRGPPREAVAGRTLRVPILGA